MKIPAKFYDMMGINKSSEGSDWIQVSTLTTTPSFNGAEFYSEFHSLGKIFDPMLFSQRLGELLFSSFIKTAE